MHCLRCHAQLAPVTEVEPSLFSAGKNNPTLLNQGNEKYILCECGAKNAVVWSATNGVPGLRISHLLSGEKS